MFRRDPNIFLSLCLATTPESYIELCTVLTRYELLKSLFLKENTKTLKKNTIECIKLHHI